ARYYDGFRQDFLQAVRKKMLRAHLMINVFDSMMAENLKELMARIRVQGTYTFDKAERYLIAQAYEPVPTINDALVLHYEAKRKNQDEHGRIDYAKRGYVISAVADELLIEYIKPKIGENGRNCRGEFLTPPEPTVKNEPTFTVGEHIAVVDTPNSIEYRAITGGYVTFEGGMYDIKTEVEVTEISFKTTGSINTELDADVSLSVKEKDSLKDAIGQGMEVTVNVIHIDGSVGANAKVTANKADVEGQVHQSAVIRAEELNINIHKGTAYGKTVRITRLEHGTVEADEVFITQAIGGKIKAKEITIEMLGSHVKMTASRKIEVKKLVGGENQFVIDPLINESVENLSERYEKMEQVKRSIQEVKKELAGYEQVWQENAASMEDLKRKLAHYRSNGVKLPTAFVQKYQEFVHFKEKIDALREELTTKEDQYDWLAQKHIALQNEIFDARIINHDGWHNHNEIIFKLINPQMNVNYVPHDEDDENVLGLYQDADGEFSIKVMPE
ncbi:MAG: flagellar assembly protein A, partial [Campylobacterota bacterium]